MTHRIHGYAEDVAAGRIVSCVATRRACERHLIDLETGHERGWHWSDEAAERPLALLPELRHYKGEWQGQRIDVEPWQRWLTGSIFGWLDERGLRRFRRVYARMSRKQGKSLMAAWWGHYLGLFDGEAGEPEIYCIASDRGQTRAVFEAAWKMRAQSPLLRRLERTEPMHGGIDSIDVRTKLHFAPPGGGWWTTLARGDKRPDGASPHAVIGDEVHTWPDGSMVDELESGMLARRQPLTILITSAGTDPESWGRQEDLRMQAILDPASGLEADRTLSCVWGLDPGDDWRDETLWPKGMPNLGVSVHLDRLREEIARAETMDPAGLRELMAKQFGLWAETSSLGWLGGDGVAAWDACAAGDDARAARRQLLEELRGGPSWGGLDLAATQDLCAYALAVPRGGVLYLLVWLWTPAASLAERSRRDRVPYERWVEDGWITATPGRAIGLDVVEAAVLELAEAYRTVEVAYDPWLALQMAQHLEARGMRTVAVGQSMAGMAEPARGLIDLVLRRLLRHDGSPVLRWMAGCASLRQDEGGRVRFVREPSAVGRRIDGIVGAAMAVGRALLSPLARQSGYATWRAPEPAAAEGAPPPPPPPPYRRRSGYATWRKGDATT